MFTVKEATTQKELNAIVQLRYKVLRQPWNQPIATATDDLEEKSVNVFIEHNGAIVACGRLQENQGHTGQIRYMAVDPLYQGKGLGKLIVTALENKALLMQLEQVELQARENAVGFYTNCGYAIREKSFLLWGVIQHFLMCKKIK